MSTIRTFVALVAVPLSLGVASSAFAYSFEKVKTKTGSAYLITCGDGSRHTMAGDTPVGKEGDTGTGTVHGGAYETCKNRGGLVSIGPCPANDLKCVGATQAAPKQVPSGK